MKYQFKLETDFSHLPSDFVVIDTETGGLDATKHALLSVAMWSPSGPADIFLMKPFGKVEPDAIKINKLDVAKCAKEGLSCGQAAERIMHFIGRRPVVGQNIAFDMSFLASRVFGIKAGSPAVRLFDSIRLYDTHNIFRSMHTEPSRLFELAAFYGVDIGDSYHDALFDAEVTGRVYLQMREEIATRRCDDLHALAEVMA